MKRLLKENMSMTGKLNTTKMYRALMQYRNTVDRDTGFSLAMALFGRELRDFLPRSKTALMGDMWQQVLSHREQPLATREARDRAKWTEHTKSQQPLQVGNHVHIQNQAGNTLKRWDKRGVVVAGKGHDQYEVRVDGSRRVTLRNRKYLRPFNPAIPVGQVRVPVTAVPQEPARPASQEPVQAETAQTADTDTAGVWDTKTQPLEIRNRQEEETPEAATERTVQPRIMTQDYQEEGEEAPGPGRSPVAAQAKLPNKDMAGTPVRSDRGQRRADQETATPQVRRSERKRRLPAWQRSGKFEMGE